MHEILILFFSIDNYNSALTEYILDDKMLSIQHAIFSNLVINHVNHRPVFSLSIIILRPL